MKTKRKRISLYKVVNGNKYIGNRKKVIGRSSWELKVFSFLDRCPLVGKWSSEEIVIPYVSPLDGKVHRYYPDIYYETVDGKKFLVEIKPLKFTVLPQKSEYESMKGGKRRYYRDLVLYNKNKAKWEAAKEFCRRNRMKFIILTENEIRNLNIPL